MPRFMMLLKNSEDQPEVPESLYHAIGETAKRWIRDGIMFDTGGLIPTAQSARVQLAGGQITTITGPFPDGDQAITAYAIVAADSLDDAVKLGGEFLGLHAEHIPHWRGASEIRQIFGGTGGPPAGPDSSVADVAHLPVGVACAVRFRRLARPN